MLQTNLDHLVIAAATLDEGVDYIRQTLGIEPAPGGQHTQMGTHNRLLQLGNGCYLEIIATCPELPAPDRPRWFALDDPFVRPVINEQPGLLTWVVNTDDMHALLAGTDMHFGIPTSMIRGDLRWLFGLPHDGRLFAGGMLPYVIQWCSNPLPADRLPDSGCSLAGLEIFHPCPGWLESALSFIHAQQLVRIKPLARGKTPYLVAHFYTPHGAETLLSISAR